MKILKWIGMFILLWFIGSVFAVVCELVYAALGLNFSIYASGIIIVLVITFGLITYGTRKQN